MLKALDISTSALVAQRTRLNAVSGNIANISSLKDENGNPYSPFWYTLNLAGQYELMAGLSFTAALENITDQRYRPYSSGIAAAGRNLILAATYHF